MCCCESAHPHRPLRRLDLTPARADAEIKRRYRQLMREVHPDANADDPQATRKAARINARLRDARRRGEAPRVRCPPSAPRRRDGDAGRRAIGGTTSTGPSSRTGRTSSPRACRCGVRRTSTCPMPRHRARRDRSRHGGAARAGARAAHDRSRIAATARCAATSRRRSRGCGGPSAGLRSRPARPRSSTSM